MTYRDIIVDATPRDGLVQTLERARDLAAGFDARLKAVCFAWPRTSVLRTALASNPLSVLEETRRMDAALAGAHDAFLQVFGSGSKTADWLSGMGEPGPPLRDHLLTADLLVTSSAPPMACALPNAGELALHGGGPVLRLGAAAASGDLSNAVIGWKDAPQARRALHDALPLLRRAQTVTVVGVGDEVEQGQLEDVAAHLKRHDAPAAVRHIPATAGSTGAADLLAEAHRLGADLIVTGAFGRGPLAQRMWGGMTSGLQDDAELSWLMSH
ncbi:MULTISPECIES: universal stress protein [Brevundimonas]|jgi:nucleotide-binding universal stress UspA family protein|uniref:Universal stress protein n=1 Tax=Brevundimonas pondensis TaxID=2774189 RepID=A0ABX7SMH9_9CAUL|nr:MULTISPECIES: universal stress protein [Brevundimonas]NWE52819.1 universal stress protein [Brevundimonas sp. P7753]QTC88723.1 universal stress protein [Brevundimonas pondensis]